MTSRVGLRLLDSLVIVGTPDPVVAAEVAALWAPFLVDVREGDAASSVTVTPLASGWRVTGPDGPAAEAPSLEAALVDVATRLNHRALAEVEGLAVHAGVVQVAGGCAALVATSGTGKSTLVAALLRAGAGYVSDEALVVDRTTGGLIGYPRPLGLSPWSGAAVGLPVAPAALPETLVAPGVLGSVQAGPLAPLRFVVALTRSDGGPGDVEQLSRQDGAALLLRHAFNHWRDPSSSFAVVHRLAADAEVLQLRLGSPSRSAGQLLDRMIGQRPPTTHDR